MYWKKTPFLVTKFFPRIIWKIPNDEQVVYLTFDDGPYKGVTDKLLDILNAKNVQGTFFCLGENIERHPLLFQKIKEHGHVIGNHGWSHLNGWKTSKKKYLDNINKGKVFSGNQLFRPPYGKFPLRSLGQISQDNTVVMWDVMSGDFDPNLGVDRCVEQVISNVQSGSIIVFHDNPKSANTMLKAIPLLIDKLRDMKYTFGNMSKLVKDD